MTKKENEVEDSTISVDGVAETLGADTPEPSQNADKVAAHLRESQADITQATEGAAGKRGRKLKPLEEIHSELKALKVPFDVDAPRAKLMRELSNTKKRAGSRGTGSKVAGLPTSEVEEIQAQKYKELGAFCAGAFFQIVSGIDPVEWKPNDIEEKSITESFQKVATHYQWSDLHPLLALTVSLIGYAVPRLKKPKTEQKFNALKKWFGKKMGKK